VKELILASNSPRRRELMKLLGHPFRCITSHVEESAVPGETPAEHVTRLSRLKAREVAARLREGVVIGSDTVVVLDGDILEKPASEDEAFSMLSRIQGRTHVVYTGFALIDAADGRESAGYETTEVTMRLMDAPLIRRYIATGEPMDKAGAYGIQGFGAALIPSIRGCYFNVMGLPISRLMETLYEFAGGEYGYFGANAETRI
jgi:septum formation protein